MALLLKTLFSLAIVFLLMFLLLKILQKYTSFSSNIGRKNNKSGLKLEGILYIDEGTKIVTVSNRKGDNYIIAVGKNGILLIDKNKAEEEILE